MVPLTIIWLWQSARTTFSLVDEAGFGTIGPTATTDPEWNVGVTLAFPALHGVLLIVKSTILGGAASRSWLYPYGAPNYLYMETAGKVLLNMLDTVINTSNYECERQPDTSPKTEHLGSLF